MGLGILANAGDGYDSDYQTNVDWIMFVTGIKKWDLYFAGAWDPWNEHQRELLRSSKVSRTTFDQLDDVEPVRVLAVVRRRNLELQRLEFAKGQAVVNGGATSSSEPGARRRHQQDRRLENIGQTSTRSATA